MSESKAACRASRVTKGVDADAHHCDTPKTRTTAASMKRRTTRSRGWVVIGSPPFGAESTRRAIARDHERLPTALLLDTLWVADHARTGRSLRRAREALRPHVPLEGPCFLPRARKDDCAGTSPGVVWRCGGHRRTVLRDCT